MSSSAPRPAEAGPAPATGRFLTLEGGEGAGKSTLLPRLATALEARGLPLTVTREPGGAPGAEAIRRLLVEGEPGRWDAMTEALLHFAARRNHLETSVRPALAAGHWVLCDRFTDSTMAYQGYGHGLGRAAVSTLDSLVTGGFRPDLTLILDIPAAVGLARTGGRDHAEDRYERMDDSFHERLRAGFLDIAARDPERCVLLDASRSPGQVARAAVAAVEARLGLEEGHP